MRGADEAGDEGALGVVVGVEGGDDARGEVALRAELEPGGGERGAPGLELVGRSEVGVEKAPAGAQDATDLAEERGEVAVAMGRLDVEHHVERGVAERQALRVPHLEREARHVEPRPAERHRARRQIDAHVAPWLEVAGHVAGAAAAAGSDLEDLAASERLEPTPPLTGNEPGTNALVGLFNGFNLLAPFWIVPAFEAKLHVSLASWQFFLRDFPLAFSALFFAVPAARWVKARLDARRRQVRNDRRRLLGRIFAGAGARPRDELAPTPALGALLDRELVTLGGDVASEPDARGRILYTFPRIAQETAAVARARDAAPAAERDAGAIVFSSAD